MTGLIIIGILLAAFALAAPRYGADSHTSDGWTGGRSRTALPRSTSRVGADLGAARAAVARAFSRGRADCRS